jgi:hypothetical protein
LLAPPDRCHEAFVLAAMKDAIEGAGMPPAEVAALVFDAVEHDRFWIPTKPSYHDQIRVRARRGISRVIHAAML